MYYNRFKKLCELKDVKASDVSKATGVATATLSSWKTGKYTPGPDKLKKIADYFGVSLDYIMTEDTEVRTDGQPNSYYMNQETAEIAQKIFENKELRVLFDAARDAKPDDLKTAYDVLLALKRKEEYSGDDPA